MKIFAPIYDWCLRLAKKKYATLVLVLDSFFESIFWPIPPDAIMIPMCLSCPRKSFHYALLTLAASVLGAMVGYWFGYFLWQVWLQALFTDLGYLKYIEVIKVWFDSWGIAFVLIAAFSPIPYKVATVSVGMMAMQAGINPMSVTEQLSFPVFVLVSIFGRGGRFYLVAGLLKIGGEKMEQKIRKNVDLLGWICGLLLAALIAYKSFAG